MGGSIGESMHKRNQNTEPVRMSSLVAVVSAAIMIILDKVGVANFTAVEVSIILSAVIALANEVARMKVFPSREQ